FVHRRHRRRVYPVGRRARLLDRLRLQQFRQPDDVRADDVRARRRDGRKRRLACARAAHARPAGRPMTTQALRSVAGGRVLDALVLLALTTLVWQGLYEYAGDSAITSPLMTLDYAASLIRTSSFWGHAQATLIAFAYSLAISIALGITLGLVLGLQRF